MASQHDGVTVRYATRQDIPIILNLIQELALYVDSVDKVQVTPELLAKSLCFAPSSLSPPDGEPTVSATRPASCLLLIPPPPESSSHSSVSPPPEPVGFALYYTNYSTWTGRPGIYLEDLFVREAYRQRGYAGRLMGELAQIVLDMGGVRLDWSVLRDNEEALKAYARLGAKSGDEWKGMRIQGDALVGLAGRAGGVSGWGGGSW